MNKARQTQKRIFKAFRMAKIGCKARYLQWLYVEYGERKTRRDKESRNFCKFLKQAERIYIHYKRENMVMTKEEKLRFEAWRNKLVVIGSRGRDFTVASRVTRA